ncbi:hypothetical protein IOD16_31055 [Saccharothrix sp. 6-C]|uniref:hypothetical protein n=1 Tax=Saccharothrix sp. 6-C TaxID=2781735 RepID=UPI0019172B29|nr:hypothetical protein [Saccharothrix sp. 6-C]QQQ75491.1 hypothetical protein IOD16_31055 [Saccharothrix sp. 6-C]
MDRLLKARTSGEVHPAESPVASSAVAQAGVDDLTSVAVEVKENRKLSSAEVAELVLAYRRGATQRELARRFKVDKHTVRAHLDRHGVARRPIRALSTSQEDEAVRLYVDHGRTLAEVGRKFAVDHSTIRNVLVKRGIPRRPAVVRDRRR